jgi:hypothetical protein
MRLKCGNPIVAFHDFGGAKSPRAICYTNESDLSKKYILINKQVPAELHDSIIAHEMRHWKDGVFYFPSLKDYHMLVRMGRRKFIYMHLQEEYRAYAAQAKALKNYEGDDKFSRSLRDMYFNKSRREFQQWVQGICVGSHASQASYYGTIYDNLLNTLRTIHNV